MDGRAKCLPPRWPPRGHVAAKGVGADLPDQSRMSFWDHVDELRRRLKTVLLAVLVLFVVFMTFSLGTVRVLGVDLPMLVPAFAADQAPMANQFFRALVASLVPVQVGGIPIQLVAKAPWDGVLVQIKAASFLALVAASPLIAHEFAGFLGPGLKPSEKRLLLRVTAPSLVLFAAGIVLCYLVVLPFSFALLYSVQGALGVNVYLLFLDDFVTFALLFLLGFGVAFELPVVMYGLSWVGLVSASFWKRHWRAAVVGILFFGALITPDGSGLTMALVSLPMLALYVVGYGLSRRAERLRFGAAKSS